MVKVVAGAVILAGECGEDDLTSANLDQMADTLSVRPPTEDDRRELVRMLRWLARLVGELERSSPVISPEGVDEADAEDRTGGSPQLES